MFVRFSIFAFLFFSFLTSLSQEADPAIDSLKDIIRTQGEDSSKVNTMVELGTLLLTSDLNEALRYGNEATDLAEKINFEKGLGFAFKLVGLVNAYQNNFPEANAQFMASLAVFRKIDFQEGVSSMLNNLGSLNFNMGEDSKAIEYYLESLKIAEDIDNKLRIGTGLVNIGNVYANKEATYAKAVNYFLEALPIFESINYREGIGTATVNIGEIYFKAGADKSALPFLKRSIEMYEGTADAALALSYVGEIYADRKEFDNALDYHKQAIEVTERLGARQYLAQSLLSYAKTLQQKGDLQASVKTYKRAQEISEEIGAKQEVMSAYEALAHGYSQLGDFKNAYRYEYLYSRIKDTLYNTNEDKKIQQLQFNFDLGKKQAEIDLQDETIKRQKIVNYAAAITGFLLLLLVVGFYQRYKYTRKTNKIIKDERDRSQELLLNILPEETARELEVNGQAQTRYYESVTVLFTDFKGFSSIAGKLSPQDLVAELNDYFIAFDEIVEKHNLEKIKTIVDAYMCAGGIPTPNDTNALEAVEAALEMQSFMEKRIAERKEQGLVAWELRIGIHTGPIVAGVVGKKKYAYDIWGDTVNVASRMESNGEPGKVNISSATFEKIKDKYECLHRGKISAKNIGEVDMYFVEEKIGISVNV